MNTCKTCKWWDEKPQTKCYLDDDAGASLHQHLCLCPHIVSTKSDSKRWNDLHNSYSDEIKPQSIQENEAHVCDGSGYLATFSTGQDFGCLHHEEKP